MTTDRTAAHRLRSARPWLLLLALLVASTPLAAQERSREKANDTRVRDSSPVSRSAAPAERGGDRTVVPRQSPPGPPAGGGRDRERAGRRGGHHGRGGHYGGGYYGGYYGHGYGYYPRYYGYWGFLFGYPYFYPPYYDGYYPRHYGYGYGPYDRYGYRRYGDDLGAIDLDVSPGRTQVYLDGEYLGTVDSYDGWPQYLWLEKGTYDLVLYLDGFRTLSRQISIYPGLVIDVSDRMEPGESVRPEDLGPRTHERRDARLRQDREMREQAERDRRDGRDIDWRDRVREERSRRDRDAGDEDEEEIGELEAEDEALDVRGEAARVRISTEPDDASVYLDGRFVGTGEELERLHSGLLVDPGEHRIAVVRPGRRSAEREFRVEAGQELEVEIELE